MKPIALYELSSVFSYFLKENGIDLINFRYAGFFIKNHEKQKKGSFQPLSNVVESITGNGFNVSPWQDISHEEYSFCLARLSKSLTNKEKLCTLLLLLDQCHNGREFYKKRTELLDSISGKLKIDPQILAIFKSLAIIPDAELTKNITSDNILLLRETDMDLLKVNTLKNNSTPPLAGYIYLQEEQLAFVRIFNTKARLNGMILELNKPYPISEGDIISFDNRLLSFNGLFRNYYNNAQFPSLKISATENTPAIYFDPVRNTLEISGCSVPENGMIFYLKLTNWLDTYLKTNPPKIRVSIRLDYFNTTSSKCILDFLFKLQAYKTDDIDLVITWFYQTGDEDLEEAGINYSEIVKIPFVLSPY